MSTKLKIQSAENDILEVESDVACMSLFIKGLVEATSTNEVIPLTNVSTPILKKIIVYCQHHVNNPAGEICMPLKSRNLEENGVSEWDASYTDMEQDMLMEVILAANYLNIPTLLDLTCAKIATMIKDKKPEEIRKQFNIKNDFTPEEEAQIREENKWCEDFSAQCTGLAPWLGHPWHLKDYVCFTPFTKEEFRKVQKLANAIHGKIYLYEHIPTQTAVVVKKMPTTNVMTFSPGLLEDALNEIGVSSYISRYGSVPHAPKMIGAYQDEEHTYFVTEYVGGGEMFEVVLQMKAFPEPVARRFIRQVFTCVKGLHAHGIIHRDISLENTLLDYSGDVRIIDFGQAVHAYRFRGPREGLLVLHTGKAGKAYYRAPEMYGSHYTGPPVDVFAVGVMLFIMAVGTPPWNMANATDSRYKYIERHGVTKLLMSWQKAQYMTSELLDLIEGLLCFDPARRLTVDQALSHAWFAGPDSVLIPPPPVKAPKVDETDRQAVSAIVDDD